MSDAQRQQASSAVSSLPGVASHWLAFACACLAPIALGSIHAQAIVVLLGGLSLALAIGIGTATTHDLDRLPPPMPITLFAKPQF